MKRYFLFACLYLATLFPSQGYSDSNPQNFRQTLNLPLSAEALKKYFSSSADHSVESFLKDLPISLQENFVLMHSSRSLHQAAPLYPRQILFGSDARFIVAAAGIADDPRYQSIEFAEFNEKTGSYQFGIVDFEGGHASVNENVAFCSNCHGKPTRPIWGQYPNWTGAYGDTKGQITDPVLSASFTEFMKNAATTPRYSHLKFKTYSDTRFLSPSRYYPYPNTNFNHELGNTVALGSMTKFKNRSDFKSIARLVLASSKSLSCIDSHYWFEISSSVQKAYKPIASQFPETSRIDVKAIRLLGLDPLKEWSLDQFGQTPGIGGGWQTGAYRLEEAVYLQILVELLGEDPVLAKMFDQEKPVIDKIYKYSQLVGEVRADALRTSSAWFLFFDVFDPVTRDKNRLDQVCSHLLGL